MSVKTYDEFMNKIVYCEYLFSFGPICIPWPDFLLIYLEDGTEYNINLQKYKDIKYVSRQELKIILPDLYERFFARKRLDSDENGNRRYNNWILPTINRDCMIREDFYNELLKNDVTIFESLEECTVSISAKNGSCRAWKSWYVRLIKTVRFVICVLWHLRGLNFTLRFRSTFLAVNSPWSR